MWTQGPYHCRPMHLALIPINPTVGDIGGNARLMVHCAAEAAALGAELIVFPELALCGYPPRDLLEQEGFVERMGDTARDLATKFPKDVTAIVGCPWRPSPDEDAAPDAIDSRARPANSALVMCDGAIIARYDKRLLPNYDIFDEVRHFARGRKPLVFEVGNKRIGIAICEDIWRAEDAKRVGRYADMRNPIEQLAALKPDILLVPSASPFVMGKIHAQQEILARIARTHNLTVVAVNQFGANDDLIFDGHAVVYAPDGDSPLIAANAPFSGAPLHIDLPTHTPAPTLPAAMDPLEQLWHALVLGVRDYCTKIGFHEIVLGLSGGIDSALTAVIAAAALGAGHVIGVAMPSRFSSQGSIDDAQSLAKILGCRLIHVPIEEAHLAFEYTLGPAFTDLDLPNETGIAEENMQARIRGTIVMGISNKSGALLVTTGNKSELAMGYSTLYGDMNGGLAVLSDLLKTEVYALARFVNEHHARLGFDAPPIPEPSITKAPSAELRPNQTDQDTLPPYDVLDVVVERYVDLRQSVQHIALETGFDVAMVKDLVRRIDRNEYKRFQLAVGLKVRPSAFGRGRRRAIVENYDHSE